MREKPWYPVAYMFVVTALFSGILIGLSAATRERVERNEQIFRERAILVAMGEATDDTPADEIHDLYTRRVKVRKVDVENESDDLENILEYQLTDEAGTTTLAIAVPIYGQGYWDEIRGVIGVQADRRTVIGIAFFQQKETPGLGAEIAEPAWRNQFSDSDDKKILADGDTPIKFRPAGQPLDSSSVHAVTGATQTCTRLERFLNERLVQWRQSTAKAIVGEVSP